MRKDLKFIRLLPRSFRVQLYEEAHDASWTVELWCELLHSHHETHLQNGIDRSDCIWKVHLSSRPRTDRENDSIGDVGFIERISNTEQLVDSYDHFFARVDHQQTSSLPWFATLAPRQIKSISLGLAGLTSQIEGKRRIFNWSESDLAEVHVANIETNRIAFSDE